MPRDLRVYLADIVAAAGNAQEFVRGRTLADYRSDLLLRSAVERQLEIAGEALNQAMALDSAVAGAIPDHGRVRALRNRLVHGYRAVDHEVVWRIVEHDLPTLRRQAQALLGAPAGGSPDEAVRDRESR